MCERTVSDTYGKIRPQGGYINNLECLVSNTDFFLWGCGTQKEIARPGASVFPEDGSWAQLQIHRSTETDSVGGSRCFQAMFTWMEISCSMERRTIKSLGGEPALGHVLEEEP